MSLDLLLSKTDIFTTCLFIDLINLRGDRKGSNAYVEERVRCVVLL